jgi:hypothetical protein
MDTLVEMIVLVFRTSTGPGIGLGTCSLIRNCPFNPGIADLSYWYDKVRRIELDR